MKRYIDEEIELEQEAIDKLNEYAKDMNRTLNELVNDILEEAISKKITIGEYLKLIETYEYSCQDKNMIPADSFFNEFFTIIDDFGKPLVHIRPCKE
jgi:hypothetical protein